MATNQTFVTQLYQNILFRTPSASEVNYWTGRLNFNEVTQSQVAQTFITSAEAQGNPAAVIRLYQSYFGRVPGLAEVAFHVNNIRTNGASLTTIAQQFSQAPEFTTRFPAGTDTTFVQNLYTNVLGRSASQAEVNYYLARLGTGESRGSVALSFNQSPEFSTNYGGVVNAALANAGIAGSIPADVSTLQQQGSVNLATLTTNLVSNPTGGGTGTGQTFTLTAGIDTIGTTGGSLNNGQTELTKLPGAGNDTFSATNTTLNTGDSIDGGAGTDTLKLTLAADATAVNMTNVENVEVMGATSAAADTSLWTGVTTFTSKSTVTDATVTAAALTAASAKAIKFGLTSTNSDLTLKANSTTAFDGTDDAVTLAVSTTGTATNRSTLKFVDSASSNEGLEALTIEATGSNFVDFNGTNALKTLTLSGAGSVDFVNTTGNAANIETVDASKNSGGVTVDLSQNTKTLKFTGGTGNDVALLGNSLTVADTIEGGTGTDVVGISDGTTLTALTAARVTGFETLRVSGTSQKVDYSLISGLTLLQVATGTSNVVNGLGATTPVEIVGDQTTSLALNLTNEAGTSDKITVTLDNLTDKTATTVGGLNVEGIETLAIVSKGAGTSDNAISSFAATNTTTKAITVAGDSNLSLNLSNTTKVATVTVDAAFTGVLKLTTAANAADAVTVTGGAGKDEFTVESTNTKANVLNGGAGDDKFTISANRIDAAGTQISGGDGTDTLVIGGTTDTLVDGDFVNINGIEKIDFDGDVAINFTAGGNVRNMFGGAGKTLVVTADDLAGTTAATINLAGLGSTVNADVTVSTGSTGANAITGSGGADKISLTTTANAGVGTITGGGGNDQITISTVAAQAQGITIAHTGTAADGVDTVTGFRVGSNGDFIASGISTGGAAATVVSSSSASNALTLAGTDEVLVLRSADATFADINAVFARLQEGTESFAASDSFYVVWQQTNGYVNISYLTNDASTSITSADTLVNMVTLVGVTDSATVTTDNFTQVA